LTHFARPRLQAMLRASTSMVSVLTARTHMPRTSCRYASPLLNRSASATKAIRWSITVEEGLRGVRCVHGHIVRPDIGSGRTRGKRGFLVDYYEPYILHVYCYARSLPTQSALSSPFATSELSPSRHLKGWVGYDRLSLLDDLSRSRSLAIRRSISVCIQLATSHWIRREGRGAQRTCVYMRPMGSAKRAKNMDVFDAKRNENKVPSANTAV
jgi:hypothetical protein